MTMAKNNNLHSAKKAKNDEFYTQLSDIEKEMVHYRDFFRGKVVYCNCDSLESNFFKYFFLNFKFLGLKKLICTSYNENGHGTFFETDCGDVNDNGIVDCDEVKATELEGNGDFRSQECIDILKTADVVVTNPPFSLFREYVAQLVEYGKKFLVIGNMNAITYKEIFPLIKDNQLWLGPSISSGDRMFTVPDSYELRASGCGIDENGKKFIRVKGVRWFTNIDHNKRHLPLDLYKKYSPEEYPHYDNYDAINVDKTADIPADFDGVMGVPITFLDKYCPEQFEIVSFRKGEDGKDLVFTREREREFNRTFVSLFDSDSWDDKKCRRESEWKDYLRSNNDKKKITEPIDYFFPNSMILGGLMNNPKDTICEGKSKYARILIRHKK